MKLPRYIPPVIEPEEEEPTMGEPWVELDEVPEDEGMSPAEALAAINEVIAPSGFARIPRLLFTPREEVPAPSAVVAVPTDGLYLPKTKAEAVAELKKWRW